VRGIPTQTRQQAAGAARLVGSRPPPQPLVPPNQPPPRCCPRRYAQELLLAKDVSLVLNVKRELLERLARCTGAQVR
jgi:hypothetical protein